MKKPPPITIVTGPPTDLRDVPDSVSEEEFARGAQVTPLPGEKVITYIGGPWTGRWEHVGDRWIRRRT